MQWISIILLKPWCTSNIKVSLLSLSFFCSCHLLSPQKLTIPCFPSPASCHAIHLHFTKSKLLFLHAWGEGCTSLSQMPNTSFLPSRAWLALKPQAWSLCGSPTCQLRTVNTSFQQLLRGPQPLWVRCLAGALPSSESCLGRTQKRLALCLFQLPWSVHT